MSEFTQEDIETGDQLRMYSIIRGDIGLQDNIGKLASQACHASKNTILLVSQLRPDLLRLYQGPQFLGTQIVLSAPDEAALIKAHKKALAAGLITSLIIDSGHIMPPFFDGSPITTALGIFGTRQQCNPITRKFKLLT